MANKVDMAKAKRVYETVCRTLDNMDLKYDRYDDDLIVTLGHQGKDMQHNFMVRVNAEKSALSVLERMPFKIDSEHLLDICVAICAINKDLICGGFSYNFGENLYFEISQFYNDIEVSEELVKRVIMTHVMTVEEYDDKLFSLNKGHIEIEDFLAELEKED